jgi:MurNAc alpha-1-phosphate uridylyltransferase
MRPLTDVVPKPLLMAGGRRLIEWQLDRLARAGICDIVVNVAHLPEQFEAVLGTGEGHGVTLTLSREGGQADDALETLGGIVRALPLLGETPFVVVSGDIVTDFDYATLQEPAAAIAAGAADAHLVLVDNPVFHLHGDMGCVDGRIDPDAARRLTYANIGVFTPRLFDGLQPVRARLFPWLYAAARAGRVTGEHFRGRWFNVGTPAELARLDVDLRTVGLEPSP